MNPRVSAAILALTASALVTSVVPASAEDDRIAGRGADVAGAPAVVDACLAYRSDFHTYFGVTFHDVDARPLVAVEVTSELYDPFGTFLVAVPEVFTGTYSPGIPIVDDGIPGAQKLPVVRTIEDVEAARTVVCSVTAVKFADGHVWRAHPAGPAAPAP